VFLCAFVENNGLSKPGAVSNLQASVNSRTGLPAQRTEPSREVKVTDSVAEAPASQKRYRRRTVVIRHDERCLKACCRLCSFTCNNDTQLELHMKTGHGPVSQKHGYFRCPSCNMRTAKKDVFVWHLSHHVGNHAIVYYSCSGCDAKKASASDLRRHIEKKHSDPGSSCKSITHNEWVRYLQNIVKCPVCEDGLLWKHIYVEHLRDKHSLLDLANYLDAKYSDKCPKSLSFPRHLLKSHAENFADFVTEVAESSDPLTVYRMHCSSCEFITNDLDAYRRHQKSHKQMRTESSSLQKDDGGGAEATQYERANPSRTAKTKACSQIVMPTSPKKQNRRRKKTNWSPKRKFAKLQRADPVNRLSSQSAEYNGPYFSRTASTAYRPLPVPVVSKKMATKPKSANNADFLRKFISKLPDFYVFPEEIKCPNCYFSSRVRVNLVRHVSLHLAVNNNSAASGSNEQLSYNLWKPDSSAASQKSSEEEPAGAGISEVRNEDAADISAAASQTSTDNSGREEQLTTSERDSFSPTESKDGSSVCDAHDSLDDEADDEMLVQREKRSCETCSLQFDLDVDLERHTSESHGGPYLCHVCGMLMWQQHEMREHYAAEHPDSQLQFKALNKKAADGGRAVASAGKNERKIARVQGNLQYCVIMLSL